MSKFTLGKRTGGFTLIGIMIVVLMIGILLAMAVPNFVKARDTSRTKGCIANLGSLLGAAEQWAMDNNQPGTATATIATLVGPTCYIHSIKTTMSCPATGANYQDFEVDTGPVCPSADQYPDHVLQ